MPIHVTGARNAELYKIVQQAVYDPAIDQNFDAGTQDALVDRCAALAAIAFTGKDKDAELAAHRILYVIYIAHLATPWDRPAVQIEHPLFARIRHVLGGRWEATERERNAELLKKLPPVEQVEDWVRAIVQSHRSNVSHPLFAFLRDEATLTQVREFFYQETPLEVLFGDIIGFMLPGVYGEPKLEMATNFWDEVGRAMDSRVHRNMRMDMMRDFKIPVDAHLEHFEALVLEELVLINSYLSMATDRNKFGQLVGMLLATENMIPGRFEHQIEGMRRLGLTDHQMSYMLEHTTIDVVHAGDWLVHVVKPVLRHNPGIVSEIAFGVLRRLNAAGGVCDRMMGHLAEFKTERPLSFEV
jgi:hypothetical protein